MAEVHRLAEKYGEDSPIKCPACARRMRVFEFAMERVDFCSSCPSFWLDAQEAERIMGDKSAPPPRAMVPASTAAVMRRLDLKEQMPPALLRRTWTSDPVKTAIVVAVAAGVVGLTQTHSFFLSMMWAAFGAGLGAFSASESKKKGPKVDAPVLTAEDSGVYLEFADKSVVLEYEPDDAFTMWSASGRVGEKVQHQLFVKAGDRPPVCVLAVPRATLLEQPRLAIINWFRGALGVEIDNQGFRRVGGSA